MAQPGQATGHKLQQLPAFAVASPFSQPPQGSGPTQHAGPPQPPPPPPEKTQVRRSAVYGDVYGAADPFYRRHSVDMGMSRQQHPAFTQAARFGGRSGAASPHPLSFDRTAGALSPSHSRESVGATSSAAHSRSPTHSRSPSPGGRGIKRAAPDDGSGSSSPLLLGVPTADKPYACDQCELTFSRQHNLKSHALTHSTERPFSCPICQTPFRRQHDLKRHMKLHTGEKPHTCTNCGRSFARLDALNRHMRAENFHACNQAAKKARTAVVPRGEDSARDDPRMSSVSAAYLEQRRASATSHPPGGAAWSHWTHRPSIAADEAMLRRMQERFGAGPIRLPGTGYGSPGDPRAPPPPPQQHQPHQQQQHSQAPLAHTAAAKPWQAYPNGAPSSAHVGMAQRQSQMASSSAAATGAPAPAPAPSTSSTTARGGRLPEQNSIFARYAQDAPASNAQPTWHGAAPPPPPPPHNALGISNGAAPGSSNSNSSIVASSGSNSISNGGKPARPHPPHFQSHQSHPSHPPHHQHPPPPPLSLAHSHPQPQQQHHHHYQQQHQQQSQQQQHLHPSKPHPPHIRLPPIEFGPARRHSLAVTSHLDRYRSHGTTPPPPPPAPSSSLRNHQQPDGAAAPHSRGDAGGDKNSSAAAAPRHTGTAPGGPHYPSPHQSVPSSAHLFQAGLPASMAGSNNTGTANGGASSAAHNASSGGVVAAPYGSQRPSLQMSPLPEGRALEQPHASAPTSAQPPSRMMDTAPLPMQASFANYTPSVRPVVQASSAAPASTAAVAAIATPPKISIANAGYITPDGERVGESSAGPSSRRGSTFAGLERYHYPASSQQQQQSQQQSQQLLPLPPPPPQMTDTRRSSIIALTNPQSEVDVRQENAELKRRLDEMEARYLKKIEELQVTVRSLEIEKSLLKSLLVEQRSSAALGDDKDGAEDVDFVAMSQSASAAAAGSSSAVVSPIVSTNGSAGAHRHHMSALGSLSSPHTASGDGYQKQQQRQQQPTSTVSTPGVGSSRQLHHNTTGN
ncbi:hypothetical protein GGI07_002212 [Coemansia sp. Benny D115]|nr:hypothetical protein GGI07_002212 [Coemansia sp. Benny D115]